ncbi:hypothetical protein SAMN03159341_12011 [Paenibacillus sp. 1_12]|uniref:hypothetical protein n=1 Tax=Paenibacillus sp. 1_12 TaxID=1566278 RepID=UPI0008EC4079|nr:hypothetical protein [Paenibacillus sp. 1_12]SFM19553.1 hypothetical protein SAMN03159341_12011 [Paenibacillus sp. 1_12]
MKLLGKLLSVVFAAGVVLLLGVQAQEEPVHANPYKANYQQYERIQKPVLVVNSDNNRNP